MIAPELISEIMRNHVRYQKALARYNKADQVEQQAEQHALKLVNDKHNTMYMDSCEFVYNKELFNEFLLYKQKELNSNGIYKDLNSVYTWTFKKELLKREKIYLLSFLKILKANGNEQAYNEFCNTLASGRITLKIKEQLLELANNLIKQLKQQPKKFTRRF